MNSAMMMLGIIMVSAFMFATDLVLVAGYGDTIHGQVTLALSIAIFGAILCDVGLASKAGVKIIASLRHDDGASVDQLKQQTVQLLLLLFGIALAGALALWLSAAWLGALFNLPPWMLQYAALWLLAGSGVRASVMVFIGFEQMARAMVITCIAEAGRFAWTCVCAQAGMELQTLYAGWAVTWLSSMALGLAMNWRLLGALGASAAALSIQPRTLLRIIWQSLPYLVPMLSAQALAPLTFTLTGLLLAQTDDGAKHISSLRICFTMAVGIRILSQSIATSFFPMIARHIKPGHPLPAHLLATSRQATHILALAALAMVVGLLGLGGVVLGLIDQISDTPTNYAAALPVLLLLTLAISADCYRVQIDQLLMGTGQVRVVTIGETTKLILLLIALPLGITLAPNEPALASAASILIVLVAVAGWRSVLAHQRFGPVGGGMALRTLFALAALLPLAWLKSHTWLVLPAAAAVILLFKLITHEDLRTARNMIRRLTSRPSTPPDRD